MEHEVLVSVIMPVHNAKQWIDRSIASALNQTLRNIEIIAINDGSTDGSEYVLEKWDAADKCVKVINHGNLGVSATRNEGIDMARGKYVCFLDADDYMESDMLYQMTQALEHTNSPIAMCDYFEENENGRRNVISLPWENMTKLDSVMIKEELIPYMIKMLPEDKYRYPNLNNNIAGTVWRICVLKQFLVDNNIRFDENMKIAEDFNFCVRAFVKADSIAIVRSSLYHYVRWNSTTMAKYRPDQFETGINNQKILRHFLKENDMYEANAVRYQGSYVDEVLSVPYNFLRPGGPGFIKKMSLLRNITKVISEDEIIKSLTIELTGNQKIAMWLIRHHMALALYVLASIRNQKYKKYEKREQ